jgi:hypothetical protein
VNDLFIAGDRLLKQTAMDKALIKEASQPAQKIAVSRLIE